MAVGSQIPGPALSAAVIRWPRPETWVSSLSAWLRPRLGTGARERLREHDTSDFYIDGSEWLELLQSELRIELDEAVSGLADVLERARVRTFHGCRTDDAGKYFRHGLRMHRREELAEELRALVARNERFAWLLPRLEDRIAELERSFGSIDEGRCYVVLDDRALLERAAHYLIYGSEWMCAVVNGRVLGPLLEHGVPTMLEIELPLQFASPSQREQLARKLLHEWTRQIATRPKRVAVVDFTFALRLDLDPEFVVGHYHPKVLHDPLNAYRLYRPKHTSCRYCAPNDPSA
jgi:hypothetical protein